MCDGDSLVSMGRRLNSRVQGTPKPAAPSVKFAEEARQYAQDGYCIVRNAIDPDLVGEMSAHLDFLQKK